MRPLYHPAVADMRVESILYALSDPIRVQILVRIAGLACARPCSDFLVVNDRTLPKSTLSQHIKVLREAGLIRSERRGIELHNTTRCAEWKDTYGPMIAEILAAYKRQCEKVG